MPVFGTMASRFNDDGVTALYQALLPRLAELGLTARAGHAADGRDAAQHAPGADRAGRARALPRRHRRRGARLQAARRCAQARLAREIQQLRASARMLAEAKPDKTNAVGAVTGLADEREARLDRARAQAAGDVARDAAGLRRRRVRRARSATRRSAPRSTTRRCRAARSARSRCRRYEDHGEILKWLLLDNVPGIVPVHRRHLRVQARGRGPDAHVRRRGRRLPHQPPLQAAVSRACRPSACRPRSTRSRSTATTRRCGPTSTARSATRASRSPRSTT